MPYVFNAEIWCDSCGHALTEDVSLIDTGDSDDFPQFCGVEETDGPNHCPAGPDCLEAIDLADYGLAPSAVLVGAELRRIGAFTNDGLTEHGREYLAEMLAEPNPTPYQKALHALWREEYGA